MAPRTRILVVALSAVLVVPLIIYVVASAVLHKRLESSRWHQDYLNGTLPDHPLYGFYAGTAEGQGGWQGKEFDAATLTGVNKFNNNGQVENQAPFRTYVSPGVQDASRQTLKIDYNVPQNPLPLRLIVDELVQVEPNRYVGKLYVRLIPFLPVGVTYFQLQLP